MPAANFPRPSFPPSFRRKPSRRLPLKISYRARSSARCDWCSVYRQAGVRHAPQEEKSDMVTMNTDTGIGSAGILDAL